MNIRKNLVKLMVASTFVVDMTLTPTLFPNVDGLDKVPFSVFSVAQAYSDEAENYYNLGEKYCSDGDYNRAIEYFTKAIQADSSFSEAYSGRALAYISLQDFENAMADLNKAISVSSDNVAAYYIRGELYRMSESYSKAIGDYGRVIELMPDFANAYYARGLCWKALGNNGLAQFDFDKARQLGYSE